MARTRKDEGLTAGRIDKLIALVAPKVAEVRTDSNIAIPELKDWLALDEALAALKTKASEPPKTRAPKGSIAAAKSPAPSSLKAAK